MSGAQVQVLVARVVHSVLQLGTVTTKALLNQSLLVDCSRVQRATSLEALPGQPCGQLNRMLCVGGLMLTALDRAY